MVELHPAVIVSVTVCMASFAIITAIVTCVIRRKKSRKQHSSTNHRKNDDVHDNINDVIVVPHKNVATDIKVDVDDYNKDFKEKNCNGDENQDDVDSEDKDGANDVSESESGADAETVKAYLDALEAGAISGKED